MSTDRTHRLAPSELALKLACREAVRAAGGQEFVALELGCAQSRISDYCSPNTRDFMPADKIARVEALGAGTPGHPHVTRALARAQDGCFVPLARAGVVGFALPQLGQLLAELADESGDVMQAMASGKLDAPIEALAPAVRSAIADECFELVELVAAAERRLRGTDTS